MIRNNFWRFVIIVVVVLWSFYETYPPTNRDLIQHFEQRARNRDTNFAQIVTTARMLAGTNAPEREFSCLREAVGTNDLTRYFPFFDAKNALYPTTTILGRLQREASGKIKLGLDLQGGTSFLVEMDTTSLTNEQMAGEALSQAVEVLRKRVDKFGVAEPIIQPEGNNRILIQLPGLSEEARAHAATNIQRAAFLEFRMVHENSDELLRNGDVPPGYEILKLKEHLKGGQERILSFLVKKKAEMTGSGIKSAMPVRGNMGEPQIHFTMNSEGAARFAQITRDNVGRFMAIVLDGELYSAPRIQGAIELGEGQITGSFSDAEARELANVLENPLKAPVRVISSTDVDATLGKDSIHSGIKASIIGVLAVSAFMLVYYLLAGMVANVALLTNIIILLGVMCSIGTTFTLPGIAGIVLTVGMAVDANVLIYERLREELAKGKSLRGAISAGYDRAFSTIFDSHITTLISSVILIWMGTGPVKGFGVTLTIGVAASLFTALVVTRLIFDWLLNRNLIKGLPMLHVIRDTKINFMRWAMPAFIASWTIIAIGLFWGYQRGQGVYGVEFIGGETLTMNVDQDRLVDVGQVRTSVDKTGVGETLIEYQKDLSNGKRTLRVTIREEGKKEEGSLSDKVLSQLQSDFKEAKFTKQSVAQVGPTVGKEIRTTAILASAMAMFGILVYVAFRYEFSFAIGAVTAIVHDVLMTLGIYFLSGRELNSTTVAAVLTIIGFSINDTIVIFDRIREDLKLGARGTFRELINQAVNQTLSRTIITSGTVFLATLSLFIFGGGPVNDFAFTFLIGIITGTYSSIYIASAVVLIWQKWFHQGQRPQIGSQVNVQTGKAAEPTSATRA